MGQYYMGCVLRYPDCNKRSKNEGKVLIAIYSHDWGCGSKLMEHSYIENRMVGAFESLINQETGEWAGNPVVWAGDYADYETHTYHKEKVNLYDLANVQDNYFKPKRKIPWDDPATGPHYRYIINLDTKEFIDTDKVAEDDYGFRIHPLPLLICEGNGRGGGDYQGAHQEWIGKWARNCVVVSDNKPGDEFVEQFVEFKENYR